MDSSNQPKLKRAGDTSGLSLRLYVAGHSPNSVAAMANLRTLCAEQDAIPPTFEIVDVLQEPERALKDGIMVTPMLVRLSPEPTVQILGALADLGRVRSALGLEAQIKHDHA
jgi:circadian clock protein KaiB